MSTNRTRYTDREWAVFAKLLESGSTIPEARQRMKAIFGRCPSRPLCYARVSKMGLSYGGRLYSDDYKRLVVELAETGKYFSTADIRSALPASLSGNRPDTCTIRAWLHDAGVKIESFGARRGSGFTRELRERAVSLMRDKGHTAAQTRAILAGEAVGRLPAVHTIQQWGTDARAREYRKEHGVVLKQRRPIAYHNDPAPEELPFLTRDWQEDEQITARLIRRDGCMLAKRRAAREQARRVAA